MPKCQFLRRKHRKVCIGDLNTLITLQTRDIVAPIFNEVDFDENFQDFSVPEVWALVETATGKAVFDGVDTDINITHMIIIRFDATVTSETWVELDDGRRLDIQFTEDLEERHEWLMMFCTLRGVGEAAKA